jgi:putative MFS transporter
LTALSLLGFAWMGDEIVGHGTILSFLLVLLLASSSGVIALLSPYTAEVFPVHIRSTASGWSAGCSKLAGVATLAVSSIGITAGMTTAALGGLVPILGAALVISSRGIETRGASLEQIQTGLGRG